LDQVSYATAPFSVRDDLAAAHRRAFVELARPGAWWSGAERVAIAAEVRRAACCALCRTRKASLSPAAGCGPHDSEGALPEAAVDAVHRIASDPARLSRGFYEKALAAGLGEGSYVELVGIVTQVVAVDAFCRALGAVPHPLPAPLPGEASRYRPAGVAAGEAWVPMIAQGRAGEAERDLLPGGRAPNVARALSLVPDAARATRSLLAAQYVPIERVPDVTFSERALTRAQMELVAGRVSALNECFY
jgi:hypothetical protein